MLHGNERKIGGSRDASHQIDDVVLEHQTYSLICLPPSSFEAPPSAATLETLVCEFSIE